MTARDPLADFALGLTSAIDGELVRSCQTLQTEVEISLRRQNAVLRTPDAIRDTAKSRSCSLEQL